MAALESLPAEILFDTFCLLPQDSRAKLALTSRKLNGPATAALYHTVYLWENVTVGRFNAQLNGKPTPRFPDWTTEYIQCRDPFGSGVRQETRIFSLERFLRTLSQSTSLLGLVMGASFECQLRGQESDVSRVIKLLLDSTNVMNVHFAPELKGVGLYKPQLTYLLSSNPALTSLQVHSREIAFDMADKSLNVPMCPDKLYSLFCIDTLKSLSIVEVRCWNISNEVATLGRAHTSNITSLSFPQSACVGGGLFELLKWPKALKSFWYEIYDNNWLSPRNGNKHLSATDFTSALDPQKATLEELFIHGNHHLGDGKGMDNITNLKPFSQLRRIGIPLTFLALGTSASRILELSESTYEEGDYGRVNTKLPASVEQLQLAVDDRGKDGDKDEFEEGELGNFLLPIATSKALCYNKLRKLVVWKEIKEESTRDVWDYDLKDITGDNELPEAFKQANIELSYTRSQVTPMFSARRFA